MAVVQIAFRRKKGKRGGNERTRVDKVTKRGADANKTGVRGGYGPGATNAKREQERKKVINKKK